MRLIDADALLKKLNEEGIPYNAEINYFITNAPTVDPFKDKSLEQLMDECFNRGYRKAVKHGKWVVAGNTTHYYVCSICCNTGDRWDNYCRSCGAKMEGGEPCHCKKK